MTSTANLYNKSKCRWAKAGDCYLMKIVVANPYPAEEKKEEIMEYTGVPKDKLNKKLVNMRVKIKKAKLVEVPVQEEDNDNDGDGLSICIRFLNSLKSSQALQFYEEMKNHRTFVKRLDPRHIEPTITRGELQKMTGHEKHNGAYFVKWMSCFITEEDFLSPPNAAPQLTLCPNTKIWISVRQNIKNICKIMNQPRFRIFKHHVTLRMKVNQLPRLSSTGMTASYLCDTNGCASKEHIILEPFTINDERTRCDGVTLTLRLATTTLPAHIIKATPCKHGQKYELNQEQFKFSCRKLRLIYLDVISLDFLNKIKK